MPSGGDQLVGASPRPHEASSSTTKFALETDLQTRKSSGQCVLQETLSPSHRRFAIARVQLGNRRWRHVTLEEKSEKFLCFLKMSHIVPLPTPTECL